MPNYRRAREGSTYFFTVVTFARRPFLCSEESRAALRMAVAETRTSHPFVVEAWVLLPDHLHCIWRLPEGDMDYSVRWGLIKRGFTRRIRDAMELPGRNASREKHREAAAWQRRFWEHMVRDEGDCEAHSDYLHYNPVKHGLVAAPKDWPFSTFHKPGRVGTAHR
jgi:putative transposase